MNTTTKRHPRSLREAFGPHASGVIEAAGSPRGQDLADSVLIGLGVVLLLVFIVGGALSYYAPDLPNFF